MKSANFKKIWLQNSVAMVTLMLTYSLQRFLKITRQILGNVAKGPFIIYVEEGGGGGGGREKYVGKIKFM